MATAANKRSKAPDKRPARARYWSTGQLRKNKVHNLVRCCGMTPEAAEKLWSESRRGRMR